MKPYLAAGVSVTLMKTMGPHSEKNIFSAVAVHMGFRLDTWMVRLTSSSRACCASRVAESMGGWGRPRGIPLTDDDDDDNDDGSEATPEVVVDEEDGTVGRVGDEPVPLD